MKSLNLVLIAAVIIIAILLLSKFNVLNKTSVPPANESCPSGQIALYEGGQFIGCEIRITSFPTPSVVIVNTESPKPTTPTVAASPTPPGSRYPNPCPSGQYALYEGGIFSGCEAYH